MAKQEENKGKGGNKKKPTKKVIPKDRITELKPKNINPQYKKKKEGNNNNDYTPIVIKLPQELENAPENIKQEYAKYIELCNKIDNNTDRYFNFVNQENGEAEMVDLMGLSGRIQNLAKKRNISDEDFALLESKVDGFQQLKYDKGRLKIKWQSWARPIIGKDVFQWKKAELIDLYSKYYTHTEIKQFLNNDGYEININNLYNFYITNKETIDKKRMEYITTSTDFYIATETGRLETLSMLHNKLLDCFKRIAELSDSKDNRLELRQLTTSICNVLEHARKEIKGDELKLTIDGKIDITASVSANQTIRDITKKIPINLIVVYLVAAKAGQDPSMLLTSLINSFYREFNGFGVINETGKPPDTAELIKNYDWQQIKSYQKQIEDYPIKIGTVVEYEEIPIIKKDVAKTKREKLLEILGRQSGNE